MKKIGLIGGTGPQSTLIYYRKLTDGVAKRTHGQFPPLTIESLSVFDVLKFSKAGDFQGLTDYLMRGINYLVKCNVDYVTLTGITPHVVINELKKRSPVPIISIMDVATDHVIHQHYQKVALLGTLPTMTQDFFKKPFVQQGITVITPSDTDRQYIGQKIEEELEAGIIKEATINHLRDIAL